MLSTVDLLVVTSSDWLLFSSQNSSNETFSYRNFFLNFRRKNLAVHLGLDDKVGIREVQKINTYCLPVPATTLDEIPEAAAAAIAGEVEVVTEDVKVNITYFIFI